MNDEPNTVKWSVGDIVIHDADRKSNKYLMQVTNVDRADGLIETTYPNIEEHSKYLNDARFLHDPARFGI